MNQIDKELGKITDTDYAIRGRVRTLY